MKHYSNNVEKLCKAEQVSLSSVICFDGTIGKHVYHLPEQVSEWMMVQ